MTLKFEVAAARQQFPALALKDGGKPRVYFDNPAGTQVPQVVIDRMVDVLKAKNANLGGLFKTTKDATALVNDAHQALADFYNAASPDEIVFGQNMTSLTFHFSRCLGNRFKAGDEIILSRMDHDANVAPWLLLAQDRGPLRRHEPVGRWCAGASAARRHQQRDGEQAEGSGCVGTSHGKASLTRRRVAGII